MRLLRSLLRLSGVHWVLQRLWLGLWPGFLWPARFPSLSLLNWLDAKMEMASAPFIIHSKNRKARSASTGIKVALAR